MKRTGRAAALAACLALTVGCGTRVDTRAAAPASSNLSELEASNTTASPLGGSSGGGIGAPQPMRPEDGARPDAGPAPARPGGTNPSRNGPGAGQTAPSPGVAPVSQSTSASQPVSARPSASGTQPAAPQPVPRDTPPPAGTGAELVIGNVGTYSGPVGANVKTILEGAQLWVRWINSRGGLNGHPIKYVVFDDGADPARHRSQVQEASDRYHVAAFLANAEFLAGRPSLEYLQSKRIPVIGNSLAEEYSYESPMMFPQATAGRPLIWAGLAAAAGQLVGQGKTKLGTLACTEAELCRSGDQIVSESASSLGLQLVYRGRMSLAQPDFTAECLAARNSGAQAMFLLFDVNSVRRLANSCARQSYRPTFIIPSGVVIADLAREPGFDGMLGHSTTFPFFGTGNPAADEFRKALGNLGKGLTEGVGLSTGWTAGKLLERAASNIPGLPTNETLLKGLWSIKNDDLGGITQPLTFTENQPATASACWFAMLIRGGAWISPDGYQRHCHSWPDARGYGYHA